MKEAPNWLVMRAAARALCGAKPVEHSLPDESYDSVILIKQANKLFPLRRKQARR